MSKILNEYKILQDGSRDRLEYSINSYAEDYNLVNISLSYSSRSDGFTYIAALKLKEKTND